MKLSDLYKGAEIIYKKEIINPKKLIFPFITTLKAHKAKFTYNIISNQNVVINDKEIPVYSNVLVQAILPYKIDSYNMVICLAYRIGFGVKIYRIWYDIQNQSYFINNNKEIIYTNFSDVDYSKIENLIQLPFPEIKEDKELNFENLKRIICEWTIDCSTMVLSLSKDKVKLAENLPIRCFKRIQKRHFLSTISIKDLRQYFSFLLIEDLKKDLFNIYEKSLLINKLLNENC